MPHAGKMATVLAGVLACGGSLWAATPGPSGNPYQLIVTRNVFGLVPIPPPDTKPIQVDPPVKIIPNGIMSSYGHWQVLFKVAAKPGGKDQFYTLAEGQRQDDIEVTKIDNSNGMVTFNNHGVVQELALADAPKLTTPAPAAPAVPGLPLPYNGRPEARNGFPNQAISGPSGIGRNNSGPGGDNGATLGAGVQPNASFIQQPQTGLSPAEQVVAIEVNRELTKQQVLNGEMPPLPPTEATPSDATGIGGAPLVAPSNGQSSPSAPGQP